MSDLYNLHKKYNSVKTKDQYPHALPYTLDIYPRYLEPRRNEKLTVLEIGIARGGSIQALRDYFPNAQIIGYDINFDGARIADPTRIQVMQGSQDDPVKLKELIAKHGPFDIIIDDARHAMAQQVTSYTTLWPHLNPRGMYFIEDVMNYHKASNQIFQYVKDNLLVASDFANKGYKTDKARIAFHPTLIMIEKVK